MKRTILLAILITAFGCGGGGSSSPQPAQDVPPQETLQSAGGIWAAPGAPDVAVTIYITEDGRMRIFDSGPRLGVGAAVVTNGNEVSGSYEVLELIAFGTVTHCEFEGTVSTRTSLVLDVTCTDANDVITERSLSFFYDSGYERDSSLAEIAGNYEDPPLGVPLSNSLSISSNGVIFGHFQNGGADCTVNGQVGVIDASFAPLEVELNLSLCAGILGSAFEGTTLEGLILNNVPGSPADSFLMLVSGMAGGTLRIFSMLFVEV